MHHRLDQTRTCRFDKCCGADISVVLLPYFCVEAERALSGDQINAGNFPAGWNLSARHRIPAEILLSFRYNRCRKNSKNPAKN